MTAEHWQSHNLLSRGLSMCQRSLALRSQGSRRWPCSGWFLCVGGLLAVPQAAGPASPCLALKPPQLLLCRPPALHCIPVDGPATL